MTYITVYNLSFNSNCRILAAKLNCTFTKNLMKYPVLHTRNTQKRIIHIAHCQLTGSQVNHSLIIYTETDPFFKTILSID